MFKPFDIWIDVGEGVVHEDGGAVVIEFEAGAESSQQAVQCKVSICVFFWSY